MSETPAELRYAASHEWAQLQDGVVTVGISDFAQDALGDVVYVELPVLDQEVAAGAEIAVVESVKAASDIYAPISGKVVAINDALEDAPERVNQDPYGAGWFFKLEPLDPAELDNLMGADAYQDHCESDEAGDES